MNIVAEFDPSAVTRDTFAVPQNGGKMVVWNESNISLTFSFQNGSNAYVPAWTAVLFCGPWGNVNVSWVQQKVLAATGAPLSQVIVEVYAAGEPVPGTFPMALTRQTNVGNQVSTVGGTSTGFQNDNNISGFQIGEATVSGDPSSAVTLSNNGHMTLGTAVNPGLLEVVGSSGNFLVATTGALTVDNRINVNLLVAESGNDIAFHVATSQRVVSTINGVDTFSINGNGINLLAGTLALLLGSISKLSFFTATIASGKNTKPHGLGATPDFVVLMPNLTSTPVNVTLGYDRATLTSTNVDIWTNNSFNIVGLAIKF